MGRFRSRVRSVAVALLLVAAGAAATAPGAHAWPWDPHVRVWFNVSGCAASSGQWGYFKANGEEGWVSWNDGYQGYFDLHQVSTSGSITKITWGVSGQSCGPRYFNITRPANGTTRTLGWIG